MTLTGRSVAQARANRRRWAMIGAAGWGAFVAGVVVLLAVGGVPAGLGRTLVVAALGVALLAGTLGLVGLTYAVHALRTVDPAMPSSPPAPPLGPAGQAPGTERWLDGRSRRARRWLLGWAVALAGLVAVFAVAGGQDRLAGFRAAEAVGLVLVLAWLVCLVGVIVNRAAVSAFRRRLIAPWQEVSCELVDRPPDAAGRLGHPRAVIGLPDGTTRIVRLRRLVVWTRLPVPADRRPHPAWWASADGRNGCLATPGGAPVITAGP